MEHFEESSYEFSDLFAESIGPSDQFLALKPVPMAKNKGKRVTRSAASNAAADEESTSSRTGSATSVESHEGEAPDSAEPKDAKVVDTGDVKCDTGSVVVSPPPPAPAKEEAEVDQDDPNASVGGVQVPSVDATQILLAKMEQLAAMVSSLGLQSVEMSERVASFLRCGGWENAGCKRPTNINIHKHNTLFIRGDAGLLIDSETLPQRSLCNS